MGREDHPVVRKGSGVLLGGPRSVESPTWKSGRPTRTSGWGQEAHLRPGRSRDAYAKGRETSGGPLGGSKGVGRTYQRSGGVEKPTPRFWIGRESHAEVWERSGVPCRGLGEVRSPTQRSGRATRWSGRGREAHPEVWGVGRLTQRCAWDRETHLVVRMGS